PRLFGYTYLGDAKRCSLIQSADRCCASPLSTMRHVSSAFINDLRIVIREIESSTFQILRTVLNIVFPEAPLLDRCVRCLGSAVMYAFEVYPQMRRMSAG